MSRNHRLKATKGKSDHRTLNRAKESNAVSAGLRAKKSPHLNDRATRIPIASRIKAEEMLASKGFPASIASAACPTWPSHCEGSRVPTMNIHITGTHKASEVLGALAG